MSSKSKFVHRCPEIFKFFIKILLLSLKYRISVGFAGTILSMRSISSRSSQSVFQLSFRRKAEKKGFFYRSIFVCKKNLVVKMGIRRLLLPRSELEYQRHQSEKVRSGKYIESPIRRHRHHQSGHHQHRNSGRSSGRSLRDSSRRHKRKHNFFDQV